MVSVSVMVVIFGSLAVSGQERGGAQATLPQILPILEQRLAQQPDHAETWRLVGKARQGQGDQEGALAALGRALELDPENAAAHHDLAHVLDALGRRDEAAYHFRRVLEIAPGCSYAETIPSWARLPVENVAPAGFEVTRLDGSEIGSEQRRRDGSGVPDMATSRRSSFFFESGVQYNTNPTLTPITQELFSSGAASWQAFANPDWEYRLFDNDTWRNGPHLRGYFAVNEGPYAEFNLASYQGGYFGEHSWDSDAVTYVSRAEYGYTLDRLGGSEFGDRHTITLSEGLIWPSGSQTTIYYSTHWSDFADDGVDPAVDSLDGWTNSVGICHSVAVGQRLLESVSIGSDVEIADIEGADYAYNGVSLYSDATIPLTTRLSFHLEGGWGYRDYHRFTGSPSRDETVWRAGARAKYAVLEWWSVSAVFNYDRFDADNADFRADRWLAGVVTTIVK